jgi:hypothetical protein
LIEEILLAIVRKRSLYPLPSDLSSSRPLVVALAAVAVVGWLLVAYFASQVMNLHRDMHDSLGRPANAHETIQGCGPQP